VRVERADPVMIPKSIDNSQVVREVDPRSSRDLFWLLALVAVLVGGLTLYAWPHFQLRQTSSATEQMAREKERLIEENRKLRLEKAALENLRRVELIATRNLGLVPPPVDRQVVVETHALLPADARLASGKPAAPVRDGAQAN
jgi:cell division protein FtsL